jgi:hypothetical protein
MQHNILTTSEGQSVIVLLPEGGEPAMVTESHPNYLRIRAALNAGEDPTEFLDGSSTKIVENLSARVSVVNGVLHFDGDPVYNGLSGTIQRYHAEGRDATNFVRFMERLSNNPVAHSREQLFTWTEAQNLTIDADGFIVGYKSVYSRDNDQDFLDAEGNVIFDLDKYPFRSSSSGHGIVDGIEINGSLPMGVGVTVEMPRDEVDHNPSEGCSSGLHVGTYDYAKGYSQRGALLEVRFDPADVVSVPSDCGFAKLRCCKYTGVAVHDEDLGDDLSVYEPEATYDDQEAWNEIGNTVPKGWVDRLKNRIGRKGKVDA